MSESETAHALPMELTLIVAATRNMGIGRAGTLPWTGLKKEMAYFARVTKHGPSYAQSQSLKNAVIMGRKTWESIPPKFQPLKGRLNIVVSRSYGAEHSPSSKAVEVDADRQPVKVGSLRQAVEYLRRPSPGDITTKSAESKVFVIGGAQIYEAALELKETRRILLTRVLSDFECDTFFPLELSDETPASRSRHDHGEKTPWVRRSQAELDAWTGEEVPEGVQEENGTRYEFQMWERES